MKRRLRRGGEWEGEEEGRGRQRGRGMYIGQRTTLGAIDLVFGDRVSHWDLQIS